MTVIESGGMTVKQMRKAGYRAGDIRTVYFDVIRFPFSSFCRFDNCRDLLKNV